MRRGGAGPPNGLPQLLQVGRAICIIPQLKHFTPAATIHPPFDRFLTTLGTFSTCVLLGLGGQDQGAYSVAGPDENDLRLAQDGMIHLRNAIRRIHPCRSG